MARALIETAKLTGLRAATFGVVGFMLFGMVSTGFAQDVALADIHSQLTDPAVTSALPSTDQLQAQPASPALTSAVLAAYVAKQQLKKGFDIFGQSPQPQLTSEMVSAYAAAHYANNSALDAIDSAAQPAHPLQASFVVPDSSMAETTTAPSVTDDALAAYARSHFEPTDRKVAKANQEELCLSKALYHEARGEGDNGEWAVANVIINRALSKRFPTTMCGVVYQNADQGRYRCQFTFACDGQPDVATERQAWIKANNIAAAAYHEFQRGERPNVVPGSALFYHTKSVTPDWSSSYKRVAEIGAHVFYSPM